MLIVKVEGSIEKALKQMKKKVAKTQLVKQLRDRQSYTSPSERRRVQKQKAIYIEHLNLEDEA